MDGIRIRGITESQNPEARNRQEHDYSEVQKILHHLNIDTNIEDVTRLGKYEVNKARTILVKIPNPYQRRMILLSARKLQTYGKPVFISRQLSKEEAEQENQALIKRRELLRQRMDPRDLRVRDGALYKRVDRKWIKVESTMRDDSS